MLDPDEETNNTSTMSESISINPQQNKEKCFSCDICGKYFIGKTDVTNHKTIHNGEKPFSCDLCDASFAQKSNLTKHSMKHLGLRPFSCDL